jgi:hypothetical protein
MLVIQPPAGLGEGVILTMKNTQLYFIFRSVRIIFKLKLDQRLIEEFFL